MGTHLRITSLQTHQFHKVSVLRKGERGNEMRRYAGITVGASFTVHACVDKKVTCGMYTHVHMERYRYEQTWAHRHPPFLRVPMGSHVVLGKSQVPHVPKNTMGSYADCNTSLNNCNGFKAAGCH